MTTKGETQLQVCRWLSTANSWEAWRQLNLQYISKRSIHFELLASIMNINFDTQPASCLQQLDAWKEQVVRYQKHSGEQLPDSIKLSAVVNGLKGSVGNFVLLNLDGACSFEDLDNLLATYFSMHDQQVFSLTNPWDKTCKDKQDETCKGKGQESNPSFKQQLGEGGKRHEKQRNGEAYPPQPPAYEGKGKPHQLPKRKQWCSMCWKKGHRTQACWWNSNQQHQQQRLQHQAWYSPNKQQHKTAEASKKRSQNQIYKTDKPVTYNGLTIEQLASSLEHEPPAASFSHLVQATTQSANKAPVNTIAMLDSLQNVSSATEAWGILVDTGAATSVAPQSFASDIVLSPAPSTLQLTTATGKAVQTYGLRKVHLQSRGLSLEVSFVIADVLTCLHPC